MGVILVSLQTVEQSWVELLQLLSVNGIRIVHLEPAGGDAINEDSLQRGKAIPQQVCFQVPDLALDRFPNHRILSSHQPDQCVLRLKGQIPGFFPGLWDGVKLLPQPRQSRLITSLRAVIHVEGLSCVSVACQTWPIPPSPRRAVTS